MKTENNKDTEHIPIVSVGFRCFIGVNIYVKSYNITSLCPVSFISFSSIISV